MSQSSLAFTKRQSCWRQELGVSIKTKVAGFKAQFKQRIIPRRADALYKASKIDPTMSRGGFLKQELPCLRHALAFDLLPPDPSIPKVRLEQLIF
jgi:hypothetical protein